MSHSPARPSDHHRFRQALGRFVTGVTVVTFDDHPADDTPRRHGLTVNSFTSVSMEPRLILVSIQRSVRSHDRLSNRPFTVNVLGADHVHLARQFAGTPNCDPAWVDGLVAPRLAEAISWFECTPWAQYDGGDHTLFIGRVEQFDAQNGGTLGFHDGRFLPIEHPPEPRIAK